MPPSACGTLSARCPSVRIPIDGSVAGQERRGTVRAVPRPVGVACRQRAGDAHSRMMPCSSAGCGDTARWHVQRTPRLRHGLRWRPACMPAWRMALRRALRGQPRTSWTRATCRGAPVCCARLPGDCATEHRARGRGCRVRRVALALVCVGGSISSPSPSWSPSIISGNRIYLTPEYTERVRL